MKKALILIFVGTFFSCNKEHPKTTFDLTVNNGTGVPVAGATLRIFASESDYFSGIVKETFTTDNNGVFSTTSSEYQDKQFYAEAEKNGILSWPATAVKGQGNIIKLSNDYSFYNDLVGKQWKLSNVTIDGASVWNSVSDCSKDDYIIFQKNLKTIYNQAANVCAGASATIETTFYLPSSKNEINAFNSLSVFRIGVPGGGLVFNDYSLLYVTTNFTVVILVGNTSGKQVVNYFTKI